MNSLVDILKTAKWVHGGRQDVLRTYVKLHQGKLGAHWIWVALSQIANGQNERDVLKEFGYVPDRNLP